jgi:hypothetical protein
VRPRFEVRRLAADHARHLQRFAGRAEEGLTLFDVLLVCFIMALFVLAGYGMARTAPATANRTTTLQRWVGIMDKTRAEAANAGALVTVAPAGSETAVTVYAGWSTANQLETYTLPVTMGLEDVSQTVASNAFSFYVRRNGSWYALLGTNPVSCTDTIRIGVYDSATSVGTDGYPISCAAFAAVPAGM